MYKVEHYLNNTFSIKKNSLDHISFTNNVNLYVIDTKKISAIDISALKEYWLHSNEISLLKQRKQNTAKNDFIVSRSLIKKIVCDYYQLFPKVVDIRFNNKHKKLEAFQNNKVLKFGICLSHSNGNLFISLTLKNIKIGVDIEQIKTSRNIQALADNFYHPQEITLVEKENIKAFYRIWTLKESLSKMLPKPLTSILNQNIFKVLAPYFSISGHFNHCDISMVANRKIDTSHILLITIEDILFNNSTVKIK